MIERPSELDVVELLSDEVGDGGPVAAGERGTVLELFDDGSAMIEIVDHRDGSTKAMLFGIPPDRLRVTWRAPRRAHKAA